MFVDKVRVQIQAGDGGDGNLSFRHEKFRARGGPDGGDGGDGGDVVLRASRNQNTLAAFRYKKLIKAESGKPGGKAKKHGRSGQALEVDVPVGTAISDMEGNVLADLTIDGEETMVARGGKGGYGNAHFVSSTRQAPQVAEKGEQGEHIEATFELKMIADVGLVGLPNAGKSTLLSIISNAKPEIADYPFTTLRPNLGVVDVDNSSLLVADIPGLIEGASQGKGLGDEFLRHIERTSLLVHLIDVYSQDIKKTYQTIIDELKTYQVDLSKRPQIIVLTKIDGADEKLVSKQLEKLKTQVPKGAKVLAISSVKRQGTDGLMRLLSAEVSKIRSKNAMKKTKESIPVIEIRQDEDYWLVTKNDSGFIVTGRKIERFARRTRFGDAHGEQRLRDIMSKLGITKELLRQGIKPGDRIEVGEPVKGNIEY